MKLKEAKEIVGYILEWQFVLMGIKERSEMSKSVDISKYSLNDLIKANSIVKSNNNRKEKLANYHRRNGHNVNGRTVNMLLADRVIAAVYTAINFSTNGEIIVLIDDIGVGCVKVNYEK